MLGWAFRLAVVGIASFYLLQWLEMRLYQDEGRLADFGGTFSGRRSDGLSSVRTMHIQCAENRGRLSAGCMTLLGM